MVPHRDLLACRFGVDVDEHKRCVSTGSVDQVVDDLERADRRGLHEHQTHEVDDRRAPAADDVNDNRSPPGCSLGDVRRPEHARLGFKKRVKAPIVEGVVAT